MRLIRISMLTILALAFAAPLPGSTRRQIGALLNKVYQNQSLVQRNFYSGAKVRYTADGQAINAGKPGAWTLDSNIQCVKLKLTRRELVIEGKRIYFLYDKTEKKLKPYLGPKVEIDIATGKEMPSLSTLQASIAKVFVTGGENPALMVPDYWMDYLRKPSGQASSAPPNKATTAPSSSNHQAKGITGQIVSFSGAQKGEAAGSEKEKPTPPRVLHKSMPPYTTEAQVAGVRGSLLLAVDIDTTGRVTKESIIKPLGMGLDDNAAQAVKTWEFKPATRGGEPIPTRIVVEVSFQPS